MLGQICNLPLRQGLPVTIIGAAQRGFVFSNCLETGAHEASIAAIAGHRADIASIDTQTLRMLQAEGGPVRDLRIIGYTDTSPGQTFICAGNCARGPYFEAIAEAISGLHSTDSVLLGLRGIVALPPAAYILPFPAHGQVVRVA